MAVISIISVNIIAPLITCFETGFSFQSWINALKGIPFIWIAVIFTVLITHKPAELLTNKIVSKEDSFNSQVTINILCTVLMMSVILTIVGTWIGTREVSFFPIKNFFFIWPRNFAIAFAVEVLIAQPIARTVMVKYHKLVDVKVK